MAKDKPIENRDYLVTQPFNLQLPGDEDETHYEAGDIFTLPKNWQEDPNIMQIHNGRLAFTHEENVGDAQIDPLNLKKKMYDKANKTVLIPVQRSEPVKAAA